MKYYVSVKMHIGSQQELVEREMSKVNSLFGKYINQNTSYIFKDKWRKRATVSFQTSANEITNLKDELIELSEDTAITFTYDKFITDDYYNEILMESVDIEDGEVMAYAEPSSERINTEKELFNYLAEV